MDLGIHLPVMQFEGDRLSFTRLAECADAAREQGFSAVSVNDHFIFQMPWLDAPTALASVLERTGDMAIATTVSLAVLRGPVPLAKTLGALDVLSDGRLIPALGPGSSQHDYDALGVPFEERWQRFDEAVAILRMLLKGEPAPEDPRFYRTPADLELAPSPRPEMPLWIGSWGSKAGLRRVARSADGWLASAYNTTPERFSQARRLLDEELAGNGRHVDGFPNGLASMWTWVSEEPPDVDRVLTEELAPLLHRDPSVLRDQVCVGSAEHCAELLSRYAEAGCGCVYLWPLGDERRQIELLASEVAPWISSG